MSYIPWIYSFLRITLHVLFVEAHGGDYGACGPVDHDIRQEVIQAEFPEQTEQVIVLQKATIRNFIEHVPSCTFPAHHLPDLCSSFQSK